MDDAGATDVLVSKLLEATGTEQDRGAVLLPRLPPPPSWILLIHIHCAVASLAEEGLEWKWEE